MLKQTITYTDFDDNETQETLYFNLTKTELADNLHIQDEIEAIQKIFEGERRELTTEDIQRVINLVKTLMRLSYGIRSEDGKRFIKSEQLWTEFTQTAAYDEFLYSLFEQQEKAIVFMSGILPKEIRSSVTEALEKADLGSDMAKRLSAQPSMKAPQPHPSTVQETPAYQREGRKPTTAEFLTMSQEELAAASDWIAQRELD